MKDLRKFAQRLRNNKRKRSKEYDLRHKTEQKVIIIKYLCYG